MKRRTLLLTGNGQTTREMLATALAVAVLFTPASVVAQQQSTGQNAPSSVQAQSGSIANLSTGPEKREPNRGAPHEGVKVHGHWVIEVKNPDGSFASRTEFENALVLGQGGGDNFLTRILTREVSVGAWTIGISGLNGPCGSPTAPKPCAIQEPGSRNAGVGDVFANLAVAQVGVPKNQPQLSGTATAARADQITTVSTYQFACAGTTSPSDCAPAPNNLFVFSFHTLATPISVQTGQIIQVQVNLSFN